MQKTKVTEYDSSSYEEICEAEDLVEEDTSDLGNQQIGTFDVIGHSPWGFSGPILQIFLSGEIRRQLK